MIKSIRQIQLLLLIIFALITLTAALTFVQSVVMETLPFILFCITIIIFLISSNINPNYSVIPALIVMLIYSAFFFFQPFLNLNITFENIEYITFSSPPIYMHFLWLSAFLTSALVAGRFSHILRKLDQDILSAKNLKQHEAIDDITGLPSEQSFYRELQQEISRNRRFNRAFAILNIQIRYFDKIYRLYCREECKQKLTTFTSLLKKVLREEDYISYFGNGEFGIILTESDLAGATILAKRFVSILNQEAISFGDDEKTKLRVKIGTAAFPLDSNDAFALLEHARLNIINV